MNRVALDIGGANIKLAHSNGTCGSIPFTLREQSASLVDALHTALAIAPFDELLVTMTGELCDCFHTKAEGINFILDAVQAVAPERAVMVWSTKGLFLPLQSARDNPIDVAAANWHALASYLSGRDPRARALLVDMGSTTTDIIPLAGGKVLAQGLTDTQRLASGELFYVGCAHTPLSALAQTVLFHGDNIGIMAEYFATTADVFLLSGDMPERPTSTDTADGRPATKHFAAARVLRMIGADLTTHDQGDAQHLAIAFADIVLHRLARALQRVGRPLQPVEHVILSGSGEFAAVKAARSAWPEASIERLSQTLGEQASTAACAYALVQLRADPSPAHTL
jgi:hypothetical protein